MVDKQENYESISERNGRRNSWLGVPATKTLVGRWVDPCQLRHRPIQGWQTAPTRPVVTVMRALLGIIELRMTLSEIPDLVDSCFKNVEFHNPASINAFGSSLHLWARNCDNHPLKSEGLFF